MKVVKNICLLLFFLLIAGNCFAQSDAEASVTFTVPVLLNNIRPDVSRFYIEAWVYDSEGKCWGGHHTSEIPLNDGDYDNTTQIIVHRGDSAMADPDAGASDHYRCVLKLIYTDPSTGNRSVDVPGPGEDPAICPNENAPFTPEVTGNIP